MKISRKAWLRGAAGAAGVAVVGAAALSIPGGGPRTYFGGIPPQYDFAPPGTLFSPEETQHELTWLVDTMRDVGVKPFAYTSEERFEAALRATITQLDHPMTARGFFLAAAPLFASLNDGHVDIEIGNDYEVWRRNGGRAFPLLPQFSEHGMFVETQTSAGLPAGTRIDAVDGVSAASFIRAVTRLKGAQTPLLRLQQSAGFVRQYYYATYGVRDRFHIRATTASGKTIEREVPATDETAMSNALKATGHVSEANYTFSRMSGGRVGYLDYRHCLDLPTFEAFLKNTFESIARNPVRGLIVDIRRNGGGSSDLNPKLWAYVARAPFSMNYLESIKVSDRLKREYGFAKYNDLYPLGWTAANGSVLTFDTTKYRSLTMTQPQAEALRFAGPVYLLIGTGTFSSAQLCAEIAADNKLAVIVGQETGEPTGSTGEVYAGYTPRIGASFGFTTKYFGDPKQVASRGVIPDVTIVPTAADIRARRDPVLEYAVTRILHQA